MNRKLLVGLAVAVILIIVIIVATRPATYTFYPYLDSDQGDVKIVTNLANNIEALKAECDKTPGCIAFNTNGVLKKSVKPQAQWVKWTNDPKKGIYVLNQ
jgi:hypothetical protein